MKIDPVDPEINCSQIKTRIPSGIWLRLYGWTVHGLYKSYTGLEGLRVDSRSANHRQNRLGHVGAHDGLWLDSDWASDTFFCHGQTETWLLESRLERARGATKDIAASKTYIPFDRLLNVLNKGSSVCNFVRNSGLRKFGNSMPTGGEYKQLTAVGLLLLAPDGDSKCGVQLTTDRRLLLALDF